MDDFANGRVAESGSDAMTGGRAAQRGMVLFVSLGLLLALTLGALAAAQTTVLELRMTRNGADAALAFYAAEAALAAAETAIGQGAAKPVLASQSYGDDAAWRDHGWPDSPSAYAIEHVASIPDAHSPEVAVYRITARGEGPGGAVVRVQATYGVALGPGADPATTGRLSWVALPWEG